MTNRNYDAPAVSADWANSRETSMPVAVAIHAIADSNRSAEAIWEAPTQAEMGHVKMALKDYIAHDDFALDADECLYWGQEKLNLFDLDAADRVQK